MKIEVIQVENERKNEFEVKYDGKLKYTAKLPFISIEVPFNLDKLREIKLYDLSGKEIYVTNYKYLKNFKEEIIPLKFLITENQKFNQLLFSSNNNTIKIYYEEDEIRNNRYVIESNGKKYFCYSIEDGYIRHFPIYDGEKQVGEILKSNILIDDKDEYCCYISDSHKFLADAITMLLLYLDRSEYSSSYLVNRSYEIKKRFSYNKTNKYYDNMWVKKNFGEEFFEIVDQNKKMVMSKLKHPIKTHKEMNKSLKGIDKKLMYLILLTPLIIILVVTIIILAF